MIYQNFDLEIICPHGGDRLCARVLESSQGDCPFIDVKWPFDAAEENAMLSEIYGGLRQRRGRSSPTSTIEDFGGRLFDAVFSGDIEHLFRSSLESASRSGKGLRVRLRLPEDSELHVRPWEFLFDTESREFLAVREHTPLVRYLPVAQPIPPITVEGPLRVLVALSSPSDHPRLDIAREWDILRNALGPSVAAGQLELRRVAGRCTFDNLRDALRYYGAHIFHFVGHGVPGALVLEQESGRGLEMEATHLRAAFPIGALPRLIVLNACSGAIAEDVPFSGLAQGFLRQGVPAVVAMQASITDDAALIFTRYFYRDLIEIGAVDTSLTEARLRMQANGHPIEWGTPVLYMRALSGQLFQPVAKTAASPAGQKRPKEAAVKAGARPSRVAPVPNTQREIGETQSQQGAVPLQADPGPGARKKPRATRVKENPPPSTPGPDPDGQAVPPPSQASEPLPSSEPAAQHIPRDTPAETSVSPPQAAPGPAERLTAPKTRVDDATPPSGREPVLDVQDAPASAGPGQAPAQAAQPGRSRKGVPAAGLLAAAAAVAVGVVTMWAATPRGATSSAPGTRPAPAANAQSPALPVPRAAAAPEPADKAERIVSGAGEQARPRRSTQREAPETRPSSTPAARKAQPAARPAPPVSADNCDHPELSERSVNCVFRDP